MARVLMVAYAACPGMGSEAGIGWNFALGMSQRHEVTLLTTDEFRPQIEAFLSAHPEVKLDVEYRNTFLPRWICGISYPLANIYYWTWQLRIIPVVRRLCRERGIDLVHHVNWGRYWMLAGAAFGGRPFVWGPIGAAEGPPVGLLDGMSPRGQFSERSRDLMRWVFARGPLTRMTARRANCAIAATRETEVELHRWGIEDIQLVSSVGVDEADLPESAAAIDTPDAREYEFISIGRLLDWKGFHLGLRAFAEAGISGARYAIVGEGPEAGRLRHLANRLGIADRVDFLGQMPRARCLGVLSRSRLLVHPSLHDSGGFVLVEAMALGRPVICLNIGGPAVIVDDSSGVRIHARRVDDAVAQLAEAMRRLHADDESYRNMSNCARERGRAEFLWSRKMEVIDQIYDRALAQRRQVSRPTFEPLPGRKAPAEPSRR